MSNLFSSFAPESWVGIPLNWVSSALVLLFIPTLFWLSPNPWSLCSTVLIGQLRKELSAAFPMNFVAGTTAITVALFLMIALNNSLGLLPYVFTSPSHGVNTVSLALPLWIGHMTLSIFSTPSNTLAHLVPLGTPMALIPFMVIIELVSSCIRPLTLSIRLAANLIAGHLLLTLLGSQGPSSPLAGSLVLLSGIVLLGTLECAVALIQAYVFSLLSTLYLGEVDSPNLR